jgi:hypothetical protein
MVAIACASSVAHADSIAVKVTEVAGDVAYVTPGRAQGLAPGVKVRLRGRDYTVIEATEKSASLKLEGTTVAVGDSGTATVDRAAASAIKTLPKPRAQSEFNKQWPDAVKPADTQSPLPVPLGAGRAAGRVHVEVLGHGFGAIAKGNSPEGDAEARVISSFDILDDHPFAADVDVAARAFSGGYDKQTHTPLFVRAAQLRYGSEYDPSLALGRLRFAASTIGMLDGGRAALHVGTFELAAFGGILPDPLSGKPDTSVSRFGTEAIYDDRKAAWQPRLAILAYGSTWKGTLDERRLSAVASANHGTTYVDGWAEAQQFPANNPWGAKVVELTSAGGSFDWRSHGDHAGFDVSYFKPERSLRLAAVLPQDWFCTRVAQDGSVPEACGSGDYWSTANVSGGLRRGRFMLDGVGSVGESHGIYRGYSASGYVRAEVEVVDGWRAFLGGSGGAGNVSVWRAGEVGVGAYLWRRLDAVVAYRPEQLDYRAATRIYFLQSIAIDSHYAMSRSIDLGGSLLGTAGPDRDALALLATVVWRPLP